MLVPIRGSVLKLIHPKTRKNLIKLPIIGNKGKLLKNLEYLKSQEWALPTPEFLGSILPLNSINNDQSLLRRSRQGARRKLTQSINIET